MIDKLQPIIQMLFQRVSIEHLLTNEESKKIYYDQLHMDYLHDLLLTYYQQYSDTEMRLQIQEVQEQMNQYNISPVYWEKTDTFNVFFLLFYYAEEVLTVYDNKVVCKYLRLLEWNELVRIIGEDLPIVSLMVQKDIAYGREQENFLWAPVIGHNNGRLDRILNKGLADNHFHLRGSAPYFDITWINLMNRPSNYQYKSILEELEYKARDKNKKSETGIRRRNLRELVFCAALIRVYLWSCLEHSQIEVLKEYDEKEYIYYTDEKSIQNKYEKKIKVQKEVSMLVSDMEKLNVYIHDIQTQIDSIAASGRYQDYMNNSVFHCGNDREQEYEILSGERWFLYQMIRRIGKPDEEFNREDFNLFYAYLRIKNELRSEFVQCNDMLGFENFQIYQGRKDLFSHTRAWKESEGRLARIAVRDVLNNPAVKALEVRITPEMTAEANKESISGYDKAILGEYNRDDVLHSLMAQIVYDIGRNEDLLKRYYYVFHFTKKPEKNEGEFVHMECRHYAYRKKLLRKAETIIKFRELYPQYGKRVLGIDACSQEIGCRPEVFGRVFRTLKNYTSPRSEECYDSSLPQLRITYHVGEDFLDVTDGLRAVDEAIRFLGMDCGDRLGHAMVLGINVADWYRLKGKQVTLTLQDYLDNVAWLHHTLIKYNIPGTDGLKGYLEKQFDYYFSYIYRKYIVPMDPKWKKEKTLMQFNINTYHLAWLLRGDKPSLYKKGFYEKNLWAKADPWERYAVNKEHPRVQDIRRIAEVSLLYYMYHYSGDVRKRGGEKRTFRISDEYIHGVTAVQKMLREELVERGIAIETNPSSNLRIGSFKAYSEHPLKVFYNNGLTRNEDELMECPQMNVSINTDDKGVFSTRLENEYALMACALEREKTPDGKKKYKKEFIYEWLDNIREMGLQQTFLNENGNSN